MSFLIHNNQFREAGWKVQRKDYGNTTCTQLFFPLLLCFLAPLFVMISAFFQCSSVTLWRHNLVEDVFLVCNDKMVNLPHNCLTVSHIAPFAWNGGALSSARIYFWSSTSVGLPNVLEIQECPCFGGLHLILTR